jgi:hypothetical protein
VDEQTDRHANRQSNGQMDGWVDRKSDGQTDGWIDGQQKGQRDGQMDRLVSYLRVSGILCGLGHRSMISLTKVFGNSHC